MKRKSGKVLSLLLSLTLLCGLCVPPAAAVGGLYSDTRGHWAENAINRWSGYGIVEGYGDEFRPDASITRAQMAKILANTLGLTETAANPFTDVAENDWFAPYVLRCYAAGVMLGSGNQAQPNVTISRQQAMVMLCRALGIAPVENPDLSAYTDSGSVGAWAAPYVAALVESGIVGGVGSGRLAPGGGMSRAALMAVLDRSIVQYINEPGSYSLTDGDGIVLVAAGNVTLTGKTSADILVTPAADGKGVTFDKAAVTGDITVQADDVKVTTKNSELPEIALTGEGSKVEEAKQNAEPKRTEYGEDNDSDDSSSSGGSGGNVPASPSDLSVSEPDKTVSSGTYRNVTITGAVGDGDVTLSNLTIQGDLTIQGGGSSSIRLVNCTILGRIIMAKAGGEPPRLHLTQTRVAKIEARTPAIVEAADAASAVTAVEAKADIEVKGESTTVAAVTVPAEAESLVAVKVTAGTVAKVEAKGAAAVTGAADSVAAVVAEAPVTVASEAVAKVEVPAAAENVVVDVRGSSAIEVEVNSETTKVSAESGAAVTVSGEAKDSITTHTHTWNEGEVTTAPTCSAEGVKTFTCTAENCPNKTKTEPIAKTAHTPVTDAAVAATCTEAGKTEGSRCSVCNAVLTAQQEIPALGHDFTGAWLSDAGGHWHKCSRCDVTDGKAAHSYPADATCDAVATCTVCNYEKAAGEHTWDEGKVTTAPTCDAAGVKTFTCSVCKQTKTEAVSALGHDWGEWVKADDANHKRTCSRDAAHTETETHTWDSGVITSEPTETTEGVKTYSCSICKGTKTEIVAVELEKNVAVPTNYSLKANSTTGISLTMTAPSTDDQQKIDGITYQYNINGDTSLRSLNPGVAGTIFLLSCSNLKAGSNSIAISITANPTAEAASEGYVAGTTSFSATVALTEGAAFDTAGISAVVSVAEDNTKTLTISGLNQNQIYELRDNTGKVKGYICADGSGVATKESINNSIDITELTLWALDFSEVTKNTASINRCAASAKISVSTAG